MANFVIEYAAMDNRGAAIRASGVVLTPIDCRRCGYNLYGLPADGPCPECGLDVWDSIVYTVDPATSGLPRVRNPGVVGDGLLWLMVSLATASLLLVVRPMAHWVDAMDPAGVGSLAGSIPSWLGLVAGLIGLAGLVCVKRLAPPAGEEPGSSVWRDVRRLGAGLAGWSILILAAWILEFAGAPRWAILALWPGIAAAAVAGLVGLRGVLGTIGLRSRDYRTARGGRQGIRAMIAATIGMAAGQVLRLVAEAMELEWLSMLGVLATSICTLMVVIGLGYLVVNAWWIRRSLRSPPPRLEEILGPPG